MLNVEFQGTHVKTVRALLDTMKEMFTGPQPLIFSDEGLTIGNINSSKSAVMKLHIEPKFFTGYKISDDARFGLSIDNLVKVFSKSPKEKATVRLSFEDATNKVDIRYEESHVVTTYQLPMHVIEESKENLQILKKSIELPLNINISCPPGFLRERLADIVPAFGNSANKVVNIAFDPNTKSLCLKTGPDSTDFGATITIPESETIKIIATDDTKDVTTSDYDLEYLLMIQKLDAIADSVSIEFAQDRPLRILYSLADGHITFMTLFAPIEKDKDS